MTLNLQSLLTGDINRLRFMGRFSTSYVNHRENVAEHSYYVALYTMFICDYADLDAYLTAEALTKALLHDCEESVTGDMPRPFKYKHSGLKALLDQSSRAEVIRLASDVTAGNRIRIDKYLRLWERARDNSQTGCIVAFADYLSVVSHLLMELDANNWSMRQHYDSMLQYTDEFDSTRFDFIRPLVTEAQTLVKEAFTHDTHQRSTQTS